MLYVWPGKDVLTPNLQTLKIVVISTPKTGNTWIRYLLAHAYNLPMRDLPGDFEAIDWTSLGPRWIAQQHFSPHANVLDAVRQQGLVVVTSFRHPGDVFVSLFHHVLRTREISDHSEEFGYMQRDGGAFGPAALRFLEDGFFQHLDLSIGWRQSGLARSVRYEELCLHPIETVEQLCASILPIERARIKQAVCECEIGELRSIQRVSRDFFRKGGSGGWKTDLPEEFWKVLATHEPYPHQFSELGYTMDPRDPKNRDSPGPLLLLNPFRGESHFENGAAIAPILKQIFFELPDEQTVGFPENVLVGPGSYFAWLNQPAAVDLVCAEEPIVITELAWWIYLSRPDIQARFPDVFGSERWLYADWFVSYGLESYGLDDASVWLRSAGMK